MRVISQFTFLLIKNYHSFLRYSFLRSLSTIAIALMTLIASCSGGYQAPVSEVAGGPRYIDTGRQHRVNAGETLYAIAWVYDLDYQLLAQVNDLYPPYTIYEGQLLSVDVHGVTLRAERPAVSRSAQGRVASQSSSSQNTNVAVAQQSTASTSVGQNRSGTSQIPNRPVNSWQWPSAGPILSNFSTSGVENKGIDIGGQTGDVVKASASGEVVYAGRGLLRYGDLVIIKHNEQFLSAYAHNSRLLVEEGDSVDQGQTIAELGSTGIDREMLHFEIRESGKPVDPMRFLPSR